MPHQKKRKTDRPTRGLKDEKTMRAAVDEVIEGRATNTIARKNGTDCMTLKRYVRKVRLLWFASQTTAACKSFYYS